MDRTRPIQLVQNNVWPLRTSVNYVKQVAYIIYIKSWGYHGTPLSQQSSATGFI